jgi:hypothetical protein
MPKNNDEQPVVTEVVETQGGDVTDVPPAPAAVVPEAPTDAPGGLAPVHPVTIGATTLWVDPEIESRQERISQLHEEIKQAERANRAKLVADERDLTIANLDRQERELEAQLARVRGDKPPEE